MDLRTFINIYDLHDNGIENIHHFPDSKQLIIDLILCNWRQDFYKAGDPELLCGELLFTGVSFYNTQAKYDKFEQDEILRADFVQPENTDKGVLEIILLATYFPSKEEEIKIIKIEAEKVLWKFVKVFEQI